MQWKAMKRAAMLVLAAMLCLPGKSSLAQQDEAEALVKDGKAALGRADFMSAQQKFKAATEIEDAQSTTKAEAYMYLGVCYYSLRERGDTVLSFTRALEQNPKLIMEEWEFNPDIVDIFNKVRSDWVTELEVLSSPSKTLVSLDGVRVGETPLVFTEMFKRIYRVRLERPRYLPVEMQVDLKQKNSVFVELQEECGVRDITVVGMKGGKPQERVTVRSDSITLTLTYSGCTDAAGRVRRVELRDTTSGRLNEILPVFLPHDSGVIEIVKKTPLEGWQSGRFEYRVRALDAAEEEEGAVVQFVIER